MKQTIYLTSSADLSIQNNQLRIDLCEKQDFYLRSIEDIQTIIIDHHSVHLTVPLINLLSKNKVLVVFCNEQHLPTTMLMDLDSNFMQSKHFRAQLEVGKVTTKQIWKQIIEKKIFNQSQLLSKLSKGDDLLKSYYMNVQSGDKTNREGIAAKVYWKQLLGSNFIRDRFGSYPNGMLNYGYAILRSAMARALMDAGLLPSVGIFHKNYYNDFPLADDLMEPYRPFIDEKVYSLVQKGKRTIDKSFKSEMLSMFYDKLTQDTLSATAHSLSRIFEGESKTIYYPEIQ